MYPLADKPQESLPSPERRYESCFARVEEQLKEDKNHAVHKIRQNALQDLLKHGFPSSRTEDWKYTDITPLLNTSFEPALHDDDSDPALKTVISDAAVDLPQSCRLVFVNGRYSPIWSCPNPEGGSKKLSRIMAKSLRAAFVESPALIANHLGEYAICNRPDHAFTALNTAFVRDGACLCVPDNISLTAPIYLLFVSTAANASVMNNPRNLIVIGKNSHITLIEHYVGPKTSTYFTNAVTEIVLSEDAGITYNRIQHEGSDAFHVGSTHIHQLAGSRLISRSITLGGALVRNDIVATLNGNGAECQLDGLYMPRGHEHMDTHTLIDHKKPECTSREHYKGIVRDKAHAVFNGKILVRPEAQKTDARQLNNNLLLSDDARVDTKPHLEIFADDVKCTHGATVGHLDEEALFYLRSRGISVDGANAILTDAFAGDIIGQIEIPALADRLKQLVSA